MGIFAAAGEGWNHLVADHQQWCARRRRPARNGGNSTFVETLAVEVEHRQLVVGVDSGLPTPRESASGWLALRPWMNPDTMAAGEPADQCSGSSPNDRIPSDGLAA